MSERSPHSHRHQGAGAAGGPVLSWDGWVAKANQIDLSWKVEVRILSEGLIWLIGGWGAIMGICIVEALLAPLFS